MDGLDLGAGKTVLPPRLEDGDRSSIGEVERAEGWLHRKPDTGGNVWILFEPIRQAHGFGTEHEDIAFAVTDVRIGGLAVGSVGKDAFRLQGRPRCIDVLVDSDDGEIVVIQAGAAKLGVGKVEAEGLHQMEFSSGDGGQTDGVARITRDFWSVEEDAEHRSILVASLWRTGQRAGPLPMAAAPLVHSPQQARQNRNHHRVRSRP